MGSELSHQRDVQVDKQAILTTDFWTLYNGELLHGNDAGQAATAVSMFQGEPVVNGQLWATSTPMDRATKNLMVYRHPSILKFLQSSVRGSRTVLVTERCRPLASDLAAQSPIEICLGLRSVLSALVFLVERAGARHLNVGLSVVYVTPGGAWRLAGFEQVWKTEEVTVRLLEISQQFRWRLALDSNELRQKGVNLEQYAFGTLCEEVLKAAPSGGRQEQDKARTEFLQYCAAQLKHPQATARPTLSSCLQLPYFNHDFITVHSFLTELPLKSAADKQHFFTHLVDRLRRFDERCVAAQLGDLLLGRMVLIDGTAQLCVLPYVLTTRRARSDNNAADDDVLYDADCDVDDTTNRLALFASATFERFIVPRLVQLFGVRETQTRLVLLEYFRGYARCVDERTMRERLLPELLLGIRDTNDVLVAATLRALADLVPLLGASTVIGRNRSAIFADGRPQAGRRDGDITVATAGDLSAVPSDWIEHRSITPVLMTSKHLAAAANGGAGGGGGHQLHASDHLVVDLSESGASTGRSQVMMLERLSPDGGEDDNKTASDAPELENDATDAWSDWEADAPVPVDGVHEVEQTTNDETSSQTRGQNTVKQSERAAPEKNRTRVTDTPPEIDYFADMEPVIQKTSVLVVADAGEQSNRLTAARPSSTLEAGVDAEAEAGWGNDVDGWEDSS